MKRSFTLIETILVVAIIAILMATLMPSLAGFRAGARGTKSLGQLKQHAAIFGAYAADQRGYFPYFTDPRATWSIVRNPSRQFAVSIAYFGAYSNWNIALADEYYDGDHLSATFQSPDDPTGIAPHSGYWYSCAMLASPRFWNPRFREGAHQWGPVRWDQTAFPDRKGLLLDSFPWRTDFSLRQRIDARLACVDGSARGIPSQNVAPGYTGGEGPLHGARHGTAWPPIHHTIDGVRGRDVQ